MRSALLLLVLYLSCSLAVLPIPYICNSVGDPHISPFTTSPIPLYSPGVQAAGYFHLAGFGGTDVYVEQRACGPAMTAYCNFKVAILNGGNKVQIEIDRIKINANPLWTPGSTLTGPTPIGPITVTRVASMAFDIKIPDGTVNVRPNGSPGWGFIQDIRIVSDVAPPFSGLCAPPSTNMPMNTFLGNNHLAFNPAPTAPFGPETFEEYSAANPTSYAPYPNPVIPPNPQIAELANIACGPLQTNQLIQQKQQLLNVNIQALVKACREDVILLEDAGVAQSHFDFAFFTISKKSDQGTVVLPFSPINSLAYGPGLSPQQPGPVYFYIQLRDAVGHSVSQAGVSFTFTTDPSSTIAFATNYLGSGLYQVLYTALQGTYTVSVSANGGTNNVLGAPFIVSV